MPHSSGGCSSGGGCHGGGRSSFGGGHGGGGTHFRASHSYFSGSRAYVRYKHGTPIVIYTNENIAKMPWFSINMIAPLVFMIILFSILTTTLASDMRVPKALKNHSAYEITITDNASVLGEDTAHLQQTLQEFKNQTGITPAVVTVSSDLWESTFNSLENYAYSLYVNMFKKNETCWLLVYSKDSQSSAVWKFECVQGDDTVSILTQKKFDKFNEEIHTQLLITQNTRADAIDEALQYLNTFVMKREASDVQCVIYIVIMVAMWGGVVFYAILPILKKIRYKDYQLVTPKATKKVTITKCEYCGGSFVPLENSCNCPHCGSASFSVEEIEKPGEEESQSKD